MPPTLEQLLQPIRLDQLGDTPVPEYHVTDWPTCDGVDGRSRRVIFDPGDGSTTDDDQILFLTPEEVASLPTSTYENIDDDQLSRILAHRGAQGALVYQGEQGARFAGLCYDASASRDGEYALYVSDVAALQNPTGSPGLQGIQFDFLPSEIAAIARGLPATDGNHTALLGAPLRTQQYGVDPGNPRSLSIVPSPGFVGRLVAAIREENSPIAANRREAMITAIEDAVSDQTGQLDFQRRTEENQRRTDGRMDDMQQDNRSMQRDNRILQGAFLYLMARGMGLTNRFESFVGNTARAVRDTPGRVWRRDFSGVRRQWRGLFERRSSVVTDLTETLRTLEVPLTDSARGILEGFDRGELPHVIFGGPSGSGKGHSVEAAFAEALRGRSGVRAFEGLELRAVRISVGTIIREAKNELNGVESRFLQALDSLRGRPTLVQWTEADQLAKAGMTTGNEFLNLLPRFLTIMEDPAYRDVFNVLESTRWENIERAAEDMLRRTSFVENAPLLPQEVREALDIGINLRQSGAKGRVAQIRYSRFTFSPESLDAITALGSFERGAPPSSHLRLMDAIATVIDRENRQNRGNIRVTQDDVIRYMARRTRSTETAVRAELRTILEGGIENNPRIEARIIEGFYRAYPNPHPENGFRNPLQPNVQFNTREEAAAGTASPSGSAGSVRPPTPQPAPVGENPLAAMIREQVNTTVRSALEAILPREQVDAALGRVLGSEVDPPPPPVVTPAAPAPRPAPVRPAAPQARVDDPNDRRLEAIADRLRGDLARRYRGVELSRHPRAVEAATQLVFTRWERGLRAEGRPLPEDFRTLPEDRLFSGVVDEFERQLEDPVALERRMEGLLREEEREGREDPIRARRGSAVR